MSSGQKWWADAYDEYTALLKRFGEKMRGGDGLGGFSFDHFRELEERARSQDATLKNWSA